MEAFVAAHQNLSGYRGDAPTLSWLFRIAAKLVRKLVPLVPPPFATLPRFHGVFAPRAKLRARVIPQPEAQAATRGSATTDTPSPTAALTPQRGTVLDALPQLRRRRPKRHRYRTDWASLRF